MKQIQLLPIMWILIYRCLNRCFMELDLKDLEKIDYVV